MKKILALLLVIVSILSFTACESANTSSDIGASSIIVPSETEDELTSESIESSSSAESKPTESKPTESKPTESKPTESKPVESKNDQSEINKPTETNKPTVSSDITESSKSVESSNLTESSEPTETSKPAHTHTFSAATCTTPAKCSCGVTNGVALGHKYSEYKCNACNRLNPNKKYIEQAPNALGIDGKGTYGRAGEDYGFVIKDECKKYVKSIDNIIATINGKNAKSI